MSKSLWDWLQLLIVPIVLAIAAFLFNRAERKNEQEIALDNQRATALQAYLDKISELLLKENLLLSKSDDKVRNVARARTLSVLSGLDERRKGSLIQFLYESGLIDVNDCIIDLSGADLKGADLSDTNLNNINLSKANLNEANLSKSFLHQANLRGTNLSKANLSNALLRKADLCWVSAKEAPIGTNSFRMEIGRTNLSGAILCGAVIVEANLKGAILTKADLRGAELSLTDFTEAIFIEANLSGAFLQEADLHGSDLTNANLTKANLTKANLLRAILRGSDLSGVDLSTTFITQDQLDMVKPSKTISI